MSTNPWVKSPPQPQRRDQSKQTKPTNRAATPARVGPGLPVELRDQTADLWCVGAHGGAGETTLAAFNDGWLAADHAWPQLADEPARCLVVCRSNARGLLAAQGAIAQWATMTDCPWTVVGLVIMADAAERPAKPIKDLTTLVAGGAPRCWQVPWVPSWRTDPDDISDVPRAVRKIMTDIHQASVRNER